tara:strand:+ start:18 stop:623 length:606 start_codon:yes stop_codon:yes gene_type:complete
MNKEFCIPIFPLNGVIFFPGTELPLNIFEKRYIDMIDYSLTRNKKIGMIQTQKNGKLFNKGCVGKIVSYNETGDGRYLISLKGENIFTVLQEKNLNKKFRIVSAKTSEVFVKKENDNFFQKKIFINKYLNLIKESQPDISLDIINNIETPLLIKFVAMSSPFQIAEKQMLLEAKSLKGLFETTNSLLDFYNKTMNEDRSIN